MFRCLLRWRSAWVLALICTICGCGGKRGPERHAIKGAVLLGGQPLKAGTIRFIPSGTTKGPAVVAAVTDGNYDVPRHVGPVLGEHRVEIEGEVPTPFEVDDEQAYAKAHKELKGKPLPRQPVPPEFNRQSTLTREVTTDTAANTFDFDLPLKPAAKR